MKNKTFLPVVLFFFATSIFGQNNANQSQNSNKAIAASIENSTGYNADFSSNLFVTDATKSKPRRDVPWFVERFKISAGYYFAVNITDISLGANDGSIGSDINFEKDLGLEKKSATFLGGLQWRATSRSRFDLSYYGLNRKTTYTIKKTFDFGDHTYNVNSSINAFINTDIYRFSYGYAILSKPKYELGLLFGAHIVKTSLEISINSTNVNLAYKDDFGVTAPLPDFGIWGGYAISDRFALIGEFDYLEVEVNNIRGKILAYNFLVEYKIIKNLDLGVGYTGLNFSVDAIEDNLNGHLKWGNNGPAVKIAYAFGKKKWD